MTTILVLMYCTQEKQKKEEPERFLNARTKNPTTTKRQMMQKIYRLFRFPAASNQYRSVQIPWLTTTDAYTGKKKHWSTLSTKDFRRRTHNERDVHFVNQHHGICCVFIFRILSYSVWLKMWLSRSWSFFFLSMS